MSRRSLRSGNLSTWLGPLVTLGLGVAGFWLLSMLKQETSQQLPERLAPLVETVAVDAADEGFSLAVDGEVIAYREVSLSAEVAGRIHTKHPDCRPGNYVPQGTLLYKIDPRDYELEIHRLEQLAVQAEVLLDELDVEERNNADLLELAGEDLALQQKDFARIESLVERQLASAAEYDTARTAVIKARNALQTLENQDRLFSTRRSRLKSEVKRLAIELEKAQLELGRTEIEAPFDGIVRGVEAELDSYVQLGAALVHLEDTSKVEVRFHLRLEKLRWLWKLASDEPPLADAARGGNYRLPPLAVDVALDIGDAQFVWRGRLDRYDGEGIQPTTRTVPCIVVVDLPQECQLVGPSSAATTLPAPPALLRGMFVTLRVQVPPRLELLRLPVAALRPGGKVWVWREGRLQIVPIEVAHTANDEILVRGDGASLAVGDTVIVSPLPVVVDGMQLRRADPADVTAVAPTPRGAS